MANNTGWKGDIVLVLVARPRHCHQAAAQGRENYKS